MVSKDINFSVLCFVSIRSNDPIITVGTVSLHFHKLYLWRKTLASIHQRNRCNETYPNK